MAEGGGGLYACARAGVSYVGPPRGAGGEGPQRPIQFRGYPCQLGREPRAGSPSGTAPRRPALSASDRLGRAPPSLDLRNPNDLRIDDLSTDSAKPRVENERPGTVYQVPRRPATDQPGPAREHHSGLVENRSRECFVSESAGLS